MSYPASPWQSPLDVPLAFALWWGGWVMFSRELQAAETLPSHIDHYESIYNSECLTYLACADRTPLPRSVIPGIFGIPTVKVSKERGLLGSLAGIGVLVDSVLPTVFELAFPKACTSPNGLTGLWCLSALARVYQADLGRTQTSMFSAEVLDHVRSDPSLLRHAENLAGLEGECDSNEARPLALTDTMFEMLEQTVRTQAMQAAAQIGQRKFTQQCAHTHRASQAAYIACDRLAVRLSHAGVSTQDARLLSAKEFAAAVSKTGFEAAVRLAGSSSDPVQK